MKFNDFMNLICNNWVLIVCCFAAIVVVISLIVTFFKLTKEQQKKRIMEWLLYAVSMAEKDLGSGTGKLKLRYVYDWFIVKFPWISIFVSFETFSKWVDDSLQEMKHLLDTNKSIDEYIKN